MAIDNSVLDFFSFDWTDTPDMVIEQLEPVLKRLGVVITLVGTDDDQYSVFVGQRKPTQQEREGVML